jgi:CDP-diacylglycerol--serine O-phosphatidyltransferase
MKLYKHLPNTLTLMNLLSGCLAILLSTQDMLVEASWLIFIAALFDFLDGMLARLLKAYSEIGKQLDSLADVVSFGVAPAFVMYQLILMSHGRQHTEIFSFELIPMLSFLLPLFAALRLAKFNIDLRQTDSFIGLPTPAAALLIASLPLVRMQLYEGQSLFYMVVTNTYFYVGIIGLLSALMVSELPLFALKFKSMGWKGNELRWIFLGISLILLVTLQYVAIPFIVLTYLFISMVVFLVEIQS